MLVLPAGHVQTDLADDRLSDADIDPVDSRPVDATDAVEFSATRATSGISSYGAAGIRAGSAS
jgi:hypothetical protein